MAAEQAAVAPAGAVVEAVGVVAEAAAEAVAAVVVTEPRRVLLSAPV